MNGSQSSLSHYNNMQNPHNHVAHDQIRSFIHQNGHHRPTQYETDDGDIFMIGGSFSQRRQEKNQFDRFSTLTNGQMGEDVYDSSTACVSDGDELTTYLPNDDVAMFEQQIEELRTRIDQLTRENMHLRQANTNCMEEIDHEQNAVDNFDEHDVEEIHTIVRYRPDMVDEATECGLLLDQAISQERSVLDSHYQIDLDAAIDKSQFPAHYWSKLEKYFTKKSITRNIGFQSRQTGFRSVEISAKPSTRCFSMVVRIPGRDKSVQCAAIDTLESVRKWVDHRYETHNPSQRERIADLIYTSTTSREEFVQKILSGLSSAPSQPRERIIGKSVDKFTSTEFDTFRRSQSTNTHPKLPNLSSTGVQVGSFTHFISRSSSPIQPSTQRIAVGVQVSIVRQEELVPDPLTSDNHPSPPPAPETSSKVNELITKGVHDVLKKVTVNERVTTTAHLVPSRSLTQDDVRHLFGTSDSPTVNIRADPHTEEELQRQRENRHQFSTQQPDNFSISTERRVVHEKSNQFLLPEDVQLDQLGDGVFPVGEQILSRSQRLGSTEVTRKYGPNVSVEHFPSGHPVPQNVSVSSAPQEQTEARQLSTPSTSSVIDPTQQTNSRTYSFQSSAHPTSHRTTQSTRESVPAEVRAACEQLAAHYRNGHSTVIDEVLSEQLDKVRDTWFNLASENDLAAVEDFVVNLKGYHDNLLRDVIRATNSQGSSTLHLAIGHGAWPVVSLILDSGHAEPDRFNSEGYTPIMVASVSKLSSPYVTNPLQRLFKMGNVNLHANTRTRATPLILAAQNGQTDVVQLLLQCSADPNLQDAAGNTALMFAVEGGHRDVVDLLLNCPNLNFQLRDNLGKNVLAIAVHRGDKQITDRIVSAMNRHGAAHYSGN